MLDPSFPFNIHQVEGVVANEEANTEWINQIERMVGD